MNPDPFVLLGIDPETDDAGIRAAYHARVRAGSVDAEVNGAYAEIRDATARAQRRWRVPTALIAPLPTPPSVAPALPVAALVAELAFLTDWELGAPHGR